MVATVEYHSFRVHCYEPLSQISTTDTDAIAQHSITLLILCLYEIWINKNNKISYITMSMPLLYNIEKFNNAVTIQSSVSMYTDVYSILSFNITDHACVIWSRTHVFMILSLARGQCLPFVYVNTHWSSRRSKAPVTLVHKFKNTCNENTRSKLHVIM